MDVAADLQRGRASYLGRAWKDAFDWLSRADRAGSLDAQDLELLARSAYMLGRDDDYVGGLERAHRAHLEAGDVPGAARCTFWIGHNHLFRGQAAPATGWFARGRRLLERMEGECVEHGYLLIPVWLEQMAAGDYEAGYATAAEAAEIGERFGDADLVWMARDDQARALLKQGHIADGLRLVDEAMVAASAGDLSPIVTGIVYCNTIAFCRSAYAFQHARACTEALTRWCERQPEMIAHNGLCLVHRAEIMQLQGAWGEALAEARRAVERFSRGVLNQLASGKAHYRQGEIQRLRGAFAAAERAYREASRSGCEPQPGMALLRLAQGDGRAAAAAIRRAVGETTDPLRRADLLPAYVDVMVAVGDVDAARAACRELDRIAMRHASELLAAVSAHARGAVALAEGDAFEALVALRSALAAWQELDAPYETARVRELVGRACGLLGDDDTANLELEAAHALFGRLGAIPDAGRVATVSGRGAARPHGLTARELEVLHLLAAGSTNREIATALVISEHTVARHVQNIFAKLGVSSRTAASAFAFEHDLA